MRSLLITCFIAAACSSLSAKDLGVQGSVFPIVERDIREMLSAQAAGVDWSSKQAEIAESAKRYLDDLPKRVLPVVDKTSTVWFDPSIVLTSDIQVPVKGADGQYTWQVLAAKGSRVNPLEQNRPVTAMFFFDGSDPDQLKLLEQVVAQESTRIVPVEAGRGSVRESHEKLARPVFHANDAMVNRFQVRYLPTLVYPGSGQYRLNLGITSFARPFNAAEVLASWPDLGKPLAAQPASR